MNEKKYSRRTFINRSLKLIAAASLLPLALKRSLIAEAKDPESDTSKSVTLDLDDNKFKALNKTGGAAYVKFEGEGKPLIVYRVSENEIAAFSSKCTHAGCKVNLPKKDRVVCPCHNSVFDIYGKRKSGPAREDLKQFSAELKGSTITITTS